MKLFNSIAIETASKCTRKCWFCPVAYNPRPDEYMSMEMLDAIFIELSDIDYKGRIELYMYSEPLRDKRMLSIVKLARKLVPRSCIMFATNTDLMKSTKQVQEFFDAGLTQMQCNIYSNMKQFRKVTEIMRKTTATEGKNMFTALSVNKNEYSVEIKFDKRITPTSTKVGNFKLANRSGLIPSLPDLTEPLTKMCVRPFRSMQINWKGEACLCCNDNRGDVVYGTVQGSSVVQLWNESKILRKYRKKLLRKDRNIKFCAKCDFDGGSYPHMIAKFWPELI